MTRNDFRSVWRGALLCLLLGACGEPGEGDAAQTATEGETKLAAAQKPDAPRVAQLGKKSRKCPAEITAGARPNGAPVDDIVGLRPGMTFDEVSWVLECRDDVPLIETAEKWNIKQTYDFPVRQLIRASNGMPCTGQEIARDMGSYGSSKKCNDGGYRLKAVKDMTEEFEVVFTGMPGEEKAGAVWRRNAFAEGENPAIETLAQSLGEKYGAPHVREKDRMGNTVLSWQYDLLGRAMSQSTQNFNHCRHNLNASFSAGHSWSAACGLTLKAVISPVYGNDLLAREMQMAVLHQKNFYDDGQQFEQDLLAAHERRKREEAAEAAKNAAGPDL